MTTIVLVGNTLAADRRVTIGDTVVGDNYKKVFKTPDGWIGAWAGSLADGHAFQAWACGDRDSMPPGGSYAGVLVDTRGRVYEFENGKPLPNPRKKKFMAWGSGTAAALGALYAGATAKKAVLIAQKIDSASGGGVDEVSI